MSLGAYIRELKNRRKKKKKLKSGTRSTDAADYYESDGFITGGSQIGLPSNPGGSSGGSTGGGGGPGGTGHG